MEVCSRRKMKVKAVETGLLQKLAIHIPEYVGAELARIED